MPTTKILVVDDNDAVREMTQEMLESKGFEVVSASSVSEALQLIVTQKFDAFVTDLHMPLPGMDSQLLPPCDTPNPKQSPLWSAATLTPRGAMAAIVLQADKIMVKPIEFKDLARLINDKLTSPRPGGTQQAQDSGNNSRRRVTWHHPALDVPS